MNILILVFLIAAGCKTASSSSLKVESEVKRVSSESQKSATKTNTKTTIKKTIKQDPSKTTDTAETFEIFKGPNGLPISVLKDRKIRTKELGGKVTATDSLKDEQVKRFEELKKQAEEAEKRRLAAEQKRLSEPSLPISCAFAGWTTFVVIGIALFFFLRFVGNRLPFPFNILAKKKE